MLLSPTNGRRILIVDDDREIATAAMVRLRSAGYSTIIADDGLAALRVMPECNPAAILLDVRMPGMDGLSLLKHLRADSETRCLPVVMFSASMADEREALKAGAKFFLAKPYSGTELLQVLQCVLAGTPVQRIAEPHQAERPVLVRQRRSVTLQPVATRREGV